MRRLLDLFCNEGGASAGYARAGFHVEGVDRVPQPGYPFTFHLGDATEWPLDGYDVVVASPPCKDHNDLAKQSGGDGTGWMLRHTIDRLTAWGGPWVVENVGRAHMPGSLVLCGTEFGLGAVSDGKYRHLKRHRQFLSNVPLMGAGGCSCAGRSIGGVYGTGGGGPMTRGHKFRVAEARQAMGIPWASSMETLSQAIPPAYTEFIGEQIMAYLNIGW